MDSENKTQVPISPAEKMRQESILLERKKKMKPISKISGKGEYRQTDEDEKPKSDLPEYGEKPFGKVDLDGNWKNFTIELGKTGNNDSQVMVMKQPYELEGSSVTIHLSNAFQQDILMRFHQELVSFLRKSLDNRHVEVKFTISEVEKESKPYTNHDKFEYLAKVNPLLREMKKRFDLDPDF